MKHKSIFNVKSIIFYFFLGLYLAWSPTAFAQWAGGSGTSANPYQINNVGQLTTLQTTVNGGTSYSGLYFKLTANINLAGNAWTPIGTSSMSFKGNFDGDNHTISGLYINTSANDVGLFGYATGSSISNLGVITAPGGVNGGNNVGILLGSQNGGTISNCYVTGAVTGNDVTGGMVGNQPSGNPTITQCFAIADVTGGSGNNGTGGIVGVLRGSMSNSYAWGEVIGTGSVGGLCGTISTNGVANSCYAVGSSNSTSYAKVGGLAGNITQTSSRLKNSVALNNMISSNYSTTAGRIAGAKVYDNAGITDNNYATSDMKVFINATPKIITSDINGLDGGTQSLASLKNQTFYSNTVSWSINNINDNSKAWNIWEGINLPYLQKQSSPVNNIYTLGTVLQGNFRSDVAMDSISVYIKTGKTYSRLAKANVNNSNHTWTCSNSALAINGTLYVITYETGKSWPSYPVSYNICNLPLTFDVVNGNTYTSALNLQTCITNLQNTTINDIQFSKAGGTAFDANIIPSPTTYSVNGVQTIYARATNKFGCQSVIKSFQVKQITTLLFKEDFGSGDGCSTKPLESGTTAYTFGGDLKTNGRYSICSQLSSYYNDYFYYGAASYDHTDPGKGHSLIVNADFEPGKFYSLKINNLCPGTHLFFSAWIFNLVNPNAYMTAQFMDQGTTFNDPDLRFVLTDGVTNAFLAEYNTGSIPKVTDPATNWRPYGFDFITASSSSVILTIYNKAPGGNGNDLMIDDIEVYRNIPPVIVEGPQYYRPGDPENLTVKKLDGTPLSADVKVNWLYSEDGSLGANAKWDIIPNFTSTHLDIPFQKPGYLRAVVGDPSSIDNKLFNCCSLSAPIRILLAPEVLIWKKDAENSNWNNPFNWVDINNEAVETVPTGNIDVQIPGNAQLFPSLDYVNTVRTSNYGEPVCRDITFHFGSEVAQPQYLTYRKAYVQYNFGYYNGSTYMTDGDSLSSGPINRGRWYALATPLKKIVSGDFSVGGFPNFWQRGFKSSQDRTGTLNGEWYNPENTLALEIGPKQNYAISVYAGEYLPGVLGEDNHSNLNDLKGILQMPYFENADINAKHRTHNYSKGISTFNYYYYDVPGLPVAINVYDQFIRGNESYRFVFEDDNNEALNDFNITVPAGSDIMIGNPFISSFNFRDFYNKNKDAIEDYYRLFDNNNFVTYSLTTGSPLAALTDTIAPLQGFFIKTKGVGSTKLYFPMSASITRAITKHQLRSAGEVYDNIFHINVANNLGNSWTSVVVNKNNPGSDVNQLFIKSGDSKYVPQIYTLNVNKNKNVIQYLQGETIEVPIGILCESKDQMKISLTIPQDIDSESLTLVDTYLKKEINLFEENTYSFKNEQENGERFLLRIGNLKSATGIGTVNNESTIRASVNKNTLEVHASEEISKVTVANVQGINLYSWTNINANDLYKTIQVPAGVYIVGTTLRNGEINVQKIIIK